MAKKTIKDYFKTVLPSFTKGLPDTTQRPSQAVREELKVVQERADR